MCVWGENCFWPPHGCFLSSQWRLVAQGPPGTRPSFWSGFQPAPLVASAVPPPPGSVSVRQKGLCQRKLFAAEPSGSALLFLFLDFVAVRVGTSFHRKFPLHQLFTSSPPICRLFGISEPNRALWGPSRLAGVRSTLVSLRQAVPRSGLSDRWEERPNLAGPPFIRSVPLGAIFFRWDFRAGPPGFDF